MTGSRNSVFDIHMAEKQIPQKHGESAFIFVDFGKRKSWNSCRNWYNCISEGFSQQTGLNSVKFNLKVWITVYSIFKINCWKKETEGKWEKKKREKRGKKKEGKRKKKERKKRKKEKKRNYFCFSTIQNRATQWAVGARSANDVRTAGEENFRYAAQNPKADPGGKYRRHTAPYGVKSGHMLLGPKMIADTSKMVPEDAHHQKQQVFRKKLFFQNFHQKNILHRVPPMEIVKNPWKLACFGLLPSAPRCLDLKLILTGA